MLKHWLADAATVVTRRAALAGDQQQTSGAEPAGSVLVPESRRTRGDPRTHILAASKTIRLSKS